VGQRAGQLDTHKQQDKSRTEQVIEAEWQPLPNPTVKLRNHYQVYKSDFTQATSIQQEALPAHAAARYRQMTSSTQPLPGTLLDTRV
jgi:hypothetical protein